MSGSALTPIDVGAPLTIVGGAGVVCEGDSCMITGASADAEPTSSAS